MNKNAKGVTATATPAEKITDDNQRVNFSTRCAVKANLPCTGERRYCSDSERLVCSSCAPSGISIDRLPEHAQDAVLRAALYG